MKFMKRVMTVVMTISMAASLMVLPQTAQAVVSVPEPAYIWQFVTVRENELRVPAAAGCDVLRSADRRPPPCR